MKYRFHPYAKQEFEEAAIYYKRISPTLGGSFIEEVENAITRILNFPEAWAPLSANTRRCRVNHFPYGVVYQITPDGILILAVMHLHRNPDYLTKRM